VGRYSVELKPSARKELERLPGKVIERMFPKLERWRMSRVRLGVRS
jgi:mRNA-degrading endonuclease RelE of RelBE toxin-antitoxin system